MMILSGKGLLPFKFPANFLGSFGPAAGALTVTGLNNGKTGLKNMGMSLIRWKTAAWSYLFAILLIIVVYFITTAIVYFIDPGLLRFQKLPGASVVIIYFFIIAILGGPLGEEIGWRGFLQPALSKRYSPAVSSLL